MKLPRLKGETWINSKPLTSSDLIGKAVLVYFWSYASAGSRRDLPYFKKWWDVYSDKGFIIIGIHAPEFSFEKLEANVKKQVRTLGVKWPIVIDNEYENWHDFKNEERSTRFLADQKGNIIYKNAKDNNYMDTERVIQGLVAAVNPDLKLPRLFNHEHEHKRNCIFPTPTLYVGNEQGAIVNKEGYHLGEAYDYLKPKKIPEDCLALKGTWLATDEYVESKKPRSGLLLNFKGTEVNFIVQPVNTPAKAKVLLNGRPIPKNIRGADLNSKSELKINKPTMYNLLKYKTPRKGRLEIIGQSGKLRAYAFSFNGCTT